MALWARLRVCFISRDEAIVGEADVSESWLFRLSRWLPYVYLLRVPLLTVAGVIGFCFAALCIGARALLGNAFDIGGAWGIFFVSFTAFLCGWVVMVT